MNAKNLLCLVSAIVFTTATLGHAQSLVEAAKQEKQRRAKIRAGGAPATVYTEGQRMGSAAAEEPTTMTDATGAAPARADGAKKKEKTTDEMRAEKQQEWAEKLKKAQDEIKAAEDALARNERALASMYNITPARADMITAIEGDKKKIAALKQSLVDLEDQRRRAGMPR